MQASVLSVVKSTSHRLQRAEHRRPSHADRVHAGGQPPRPGKADQRHNLVCFVVVLRRSTEGLASAAEPPRFSLLPPHAGFRAHPAP